MSHGPKVVWNDILLNDNGSVEIYSMTLTQSLSKFTVKFKINFWLYDKFYVQKGFTILRKEPNNLYKMYKLITTI